jgi:acid phosphatase family membrane protein YuiD
VQEALTKQGLGRVDIRNLTAASREAVSKTIKRQVFLFYMHRKIFLLLLFGGIASSHLFGAVQNSLSTSAGLRARSYTISTFKETNQLRAC